MRCVFKMNEAMMRYICKVHQYWYIKYHYKWQQESQQLQRHTSMVRIHCLGWPSNDTHNTDKLTCKPLLTFSRHCKTIYGSSPLYSLSILFHCADCQLKQHIHRLSTLWYICPCTENEKYWQCCCCHHCRCHHHQNLLDKLSNYWKKDFWSWEYKI